MKYLLILPLFLIGCVKHKCVQAETVVSIGGCDKYGDCGIKLSDGSITRSEYPVEGQQFCVRYEKTN